MIEFIKQDKFIKYNDFNYLCMGKIPYLQTVEGWNEITNTFGPIKSYIEYHYVYCHEFITDIAKLRNVLYWLGNVPEESLKIPDNYDFLIDEDCKINILNINNVDVSGRITNYVKICYNSSFIQKELPDFIQFNVCECGVVINNTVCHYYRAAIGLENIPKITSLKGVPQFIRNIEKDFNIRDPYNSYSFVADKCNILSIEGGPKEVDGRYDVFNNNLTSLLGGPEKVGSFNAKCNKITSLEGGPKYVKGDYNVIKNNISSLKGAPLKVGGKFNLNTNSLTDESLDFVFNSKTKYDWYELSIMWNPSLIRYRKK